MRWLINFLFKKRKLKQIEQFSSENYSKKISIKIKIKAKLALWKNFWQPSDAKKKISS